MELPNGGMMKKIASLLLLVTAILLSLSSCESTAEKAAREAAEKEAESRVAEVESLISEIGRVDIDSEEKIVKAERAYEALIDEEQNKVGNYNVLLKAKYDFDAIPKPVEVSISNIRDYISVDREVTDYESYTHPSGIRFSYANVKVTFYPIKAGSFSDTELELYLDVPGTGWSVTSSDPAYKAENDKHMYFSFKMPSTGYYSKTVRIGSLFSISDPREYTNNPPFYVLDAKGTFVESK